MISLKQVKLIDITVVRSMTEDDLKPYSPAHGDRLALKSFASKSRRISLIEKLRTTFDSFGESSQPRPHSKPAKKAKGNNLKETRMIEIGWKIYCPKKKEFRPVRKPTGGTRRISVPKIMKYNDILAKAIDLFFPDGSSSYGHIREFEYELQDYKSLKIVEDIDINKMYEVSGTNTLRFYLATTKHEKDTDFMPAVTKPPDTFTMSLRNSSEPNSLNLERLVENIFGADANESPMDMFYLNENNIYDLPANTSYAPEYAPGSTSRTNTNSVSNTLASLTEIRNMTHNPSDPASFESPPEEREVLIVHRGHVFSEILTAMKERNIQFKHVQVEMILPNGTSEKAEDVGGVLRDAISEFFLTFYDACTMGTELKVPTLRHDFQYKEWEAVAKIIVESYISQQYFPIKIAPVFVKSCLGLELDEKEVLENFLMYVSPSDALLLKKALIDFDSVDIDDILEFCSNYDGKWVPTKDSFEKLLGQIAFEELVQKPNYVQACWQNAFQKNLGDLNLDEIYSKYAPTDKNILCMLDVPENLDDEQRKVVAFLKKFIKESDEKTRSSFLRFCTGSNLANAKILIHFNDNTGLSRAPVAHTCNNLLELPTTYENFMIFRSELNNILNAGVWVMDII
ncbi:unnamed protein product [Ceutorhynchus assimilis]|uniref:HECT domain-containing protein n=1 Tax=Ceutorhynchus assimilis TaxID=467358 RepID=A0A9N9QBI2_9CUCU|nr:unnamed protein product [Ceutorhynchus assimilis]